MLNETADKRRLQIRAGTKRSTRWYVLVILKKKKKREMFLHQWASFRQGSRAGADRVCRCQQSLATFSRTTHKDQDKPARLRLPSEDAARASCRSDCANARPPPAGAVMDEPSGSGGWLHLQFSVTLPQLLPRPPPSSIALSRTLVFGDI